MPKSWEKPKDPRSISTLSECERWRRQVCDDMNEKLTRLYTEPLPDAETRYLNDEVNSLIRELRRWELRIIELGGIDYSRVGPKTPDGDILNTNLNQYQYFGRARRLPGVKELLDQEKRRRLEVAGSGRPNTKAELLKKIDSNYYGLIENPEIEEIEAKVEGFMGFSPDPIIEPGFIPTNNQIVTAINYIYSNGASQSMIIEDGQ